MDPARESLSEKALLLGYELSSNSETRLHFVAAGFTRITGRHRLSRNPTDYGGWLSLPSYKYEDYTTLGFTASYSTQKIYFSSPGVGMTIGGTFSEEINYLSASFSLNFGYFDTDY